ncbi:ATP-grasp domain-containing protein, partial [Streptomyces sp. NPDC059104]
PSAPPAQATASAPPAGRRPGPVRAAPPRERRGRVEAAWFAADDLGPFLAMLGAFLGRGLGKGARALRGVPEQGRRGARAVRAPRQRGGERPGPPARRTPPEAPAEPDELVTR